MKQLVKVAAVAMTGLLLVACGESAEKKPEAKTDVIVVQPAAAPEEAKEAAPAAEEATPAPEATPAEEATTAPEASQE